jgi:prepilin-type N-terminal cleavage/methylation domain-containing protein/prepilin-type processing-associated H-X9-DG protein
MNSKSRIEVKSLKPKNSFTLIELLVVVAIIAVLIALLLPSLKSARDVAKRVVCASQMRQYGMATQMYLYQYNQIPWFAFSNSPMTGLWYDALKSFVGLPGEDSDEKIRRCSTGEAWIGAHYGGENYGDPVAPFVYNKVDGKIQKPVTLAECEDPAGWALFLDSFDFFVYTPSASYWRLRYDTDNDGILDSMNPTNPLEKYNRAQPRVHSEGCNLVLGDGHVEWVAFRELFKSFRGQVVHRFWWRDR